MANRIERPSEISRNDEDIVIALKHRCDLLQEVDERGSGRPGWSKGELVRYLICHRGRRKGWVQVGRHHQPLDQSRQNRHYRDGAVVGRPLRSLVLWDRMNNCQLPLLRHKGTAQGKVYEARETASTDRRQQPQVPGRQPVNSSAVGRSRSRAVKICISLKVSI